MNKVKKVRADAKAKPVQVQPQMAGAPVMREGSTTAKNDWFQIGFNEQEVADLKVLHRDTWERPDNFPIERTVRLYVLAALAHYDIWWTAMFRMRNADECGMWRRFGDGYGSAVMQIGLSKWQHAALMKVRAETRRCHKFERQPDTVRFLALFVIRYFKHLRPQLVKDAAYINAEGFEIGTYYTGMMKAHFKLDIAAADGAAGKGGGL